MRARTLIGLVAVAVLSGCGLESVIGSAIQDTSERPASRIVGAVAWPEAPNATVGALDPEGAALEPFQIALPPGRYEVRLPSSSYGMIRVQGRAGNLQLRALVPQVGEESTATEDLDARAMTEVLLLEAWASSEPPEGEPARSLGLVTPSAYAGDGSTSGTRTAIRRAMDEAGPVQDLLRMVERLIGRANVSSGTAEPAFFRIPAIDAAGAVTTSPLDGAYLVRLPFDYDGDGVAESTTADFDAKLLEAMAILETYDPTGCPDTRPDGPIRTVFSVDFNEGGIDGNGDRVNRFKWATDRPGKTMFFVGWIHADSPIQAAQAPGVVNALGNSTPNQVVMYDDGTNGDEVAEDSIYSITFDLPRGLRVGYKYTWGTRGAVWTGSEEWPGNSRIIQIEDMNGDAFVYRRDVFADEATNKDRANLKTGSGGSIGWDTVLRGCTLDAVPIPEAREQGFVEGNAQLCGPFYTPQKIGPVKIACPVP